MGELHTFNEDPAPITARQTICGGCHVVIPTTYDQHLPMHRIENEAFETGGHVEHRMEG